jgi:hypothetical protein
MLSHQDYYRPFLDAFHVDTDLSQEAIDKANARKQQEQQPEQQQEPAASQPQDTQQQGSVMQQVGDVKPAAGQPAAAPQPTASSAPGVAGVASSSRQQQGAGLQGHSAAAAATVS